MTPLKRASAPSVPQSVTDVEELLARIGRLQSDLNRHSEALTAHITTLNERAAEQRRPIEEEIERLSQGVQAYCESRRAELTGHGRAQSLKFATGTVSWRKGRPRVEVTGNEASLIDTLKRLGLAHLVRLKEELDKAEILRNPHRVPQLPGLAIITAPETFTIEPRS